jgi:hypothetical protein
LGYISNKFTKMKRLITFFLVFIALFSCKKKEIIEDPVNPIKEYAAKVWREGCDDHEFYHILNGDTLPPQNLPAEMNFIVKTGDKIKLQIYFNHGLPFYCQLIGMKLFLDGKQVAYQQGHNNDVFLTYIVE